MKSLSNLKSVLHRVHHDQKGGLSLETILIIGAIALPILIFLIAVAWPRMQEFFNQGMTDLEKVHERKKLIMISLTVLFALLIVATRDRFDKAQNLQLDDVLGHCRRNDLGCYSDLHGGRRFSAVGLKQVFLGFCFVAGSCWFVLSVSRSVAGK